MILLRRTLALLLGWLLTFMALAMAGGGHALWNAFGAADEHAGLLHASALVIVADAIFLGLLASKGSERSKIILGFFAVAGMLLSVAGFAAIHHAW